MNEFIFHNVGQGLFYSGHLMNRSYNFIYDCGSKSGEKFLYAAIDENLPKVDIDFAVISHLHADHINGINYLIQRQKIKKFYLPYFGNGNLKFD